MISYYALCKLVGCFPSQLIQRAHRHKAVFIKLYLSIIKHKVGITQFAYLVCHLIHRSRTFVSLLHCHLRLDLYLTPAIAVLELYRFTLDKLHFCIYRKLDILVDISGSDILYKSLIAFPVLRLTCDSYHITPVPAV